MLNRIQPNHSSVRKDRRGIGDEREADGGPVDPGVVREVAEIVVDVEDPVSRSA
jgi:hypothetical protein